MRDRPDAIIVAICRLMTARSLSPTPFSNPGIRISIWRPVPPPDSVIVVGWTFMLRSRVTTALSLGASMRPFTSLPATSRPR